MTFLLSMPGGSEWIFMIFVLLCLLTTPVLTIVFYMRNRELKKQVEALTNEKNLLLAKLLDK